MVRAPHGKALPWLRLSSTLILPLGRRRLNFVVDGPDSTDCNVDKTCVPGLGRSNPAPDERHPGGSMGHIGGMLHAYSGATISESVLTDQRLGAQGVFYRQISAARRLPSSLSDSRPWGTLCTMIANAWRPPSGLLARATNSRLSPNLRSGVRLQRPRSVP